MTTEELEHQLNSLYRYLHRDLGGTVPVERVVSVARAHYESLSRNATINDFIPLLVYRYAREELIRDRHVGLHHAA